MTSKPSPYAPLAFSLLTILCQVCALGLSFSLGALCPSPFMALAPAPFASFLLARFLGLSTPWLILNAILPIAIASSLVVEIPSSVFLVPFVTLSLIYAPAFWTRVPYYPTSKAAYPLILAELPNDRPFIFADIGCGFGDLLFFLSKHRPHGTFVGVEIGFIPMAYARLKAACLRRDVRIHFTSMWNVSVGECDFVYTFLSPAPMGRLWDKLSTEMKPGSTFISNTFDVPAVPDETVRVKDERGGALLLFRMKGPRLLKTSKH
jgi:hypothetical protein